MSKYNKETIQDIQSEIFKMKKKYDMDWKTLELYICKAFNSIDKEDKK